MSKKAVKTKHHIKIKPEDGRIVPESMPVVETDNTRGAITIGNKDNSKQDIFTRDEFLHALNIVSKPGEGE